MNILEAKDILRLSIMTQVPVFLHGGPGIGKSDAVKQIAKDLDLQLIDVRLSQLDATDLKGIPVPNREAKLCDWFPPAFLPKEGKGILFFDEMNQAPKLIQAACLQLLLDRRVGDYKLPEGFAMIAAGNRQEDGCAVIPLSAAVKSRMLHITIEPDSDIWLPWAKDNNIHPEILSFIQFRRELFYKSPGDEGDAFPNPRTWCFASKLLSALDKSVKENVKYHVAPHDLRKRSVAMAVGDATAKEYKVWYEVYRHVDVEKILKAGTIPGFNKENASFQYATVSAIAIFLTKMDSKAIKPAIPKIAALLEDIAKPELKALFFKSIPVKTLTLLSLDPSMSKVAKEIVDILGRFSS